MTILIKSVLLDEKTQDIFLENGVIREISDNHYSDSEKSVQSS